MHAAVRRGVALGASVLAVAAPPVDAQVGSADVSSIGSSTGRSTTSSVIGSSTDSGRAFSIVPTFSISETLTDNRQLSTTKRADLITEVRPGVHLNSNG